MSTTAIRMFKKLLLKQERNYKKDVFVGLIFLVIAIVAYLINQATGNLLVITYLFVTSTANFAENDIFWNANDFRSLGITAHSKQYFVFFLWQRILLDSFVSNLIVGVGLSVFLLIKFGIMQVLFFLMLVMLYFIISPICSIIYSKKNKITTVFCVCGLLIIPCLLWLDFIFWHLATSLYLVCTIVDFLYCFLFSVICFLFFTVISKTCKAQKNNNYPSRIIFKFLKRLDIWIYKDYMLNYKMVLTNIVSFAITLLLFVDSDDMGILRPFLLWLVCGSKLFSVKDKKTKRHLLVVNDPLFCRRTVDQDIIFVRRKKFKAIMTGSLVKFLVILPFLIVLGFTSVEDIFIFGITSVISALFECFTIYKNGMSTQMIIYLTMTTIPVVWGCIILNHYSLMFLYIYLVVAMLISVFLLLDVISKKKAEKNATVI